MRKAEVYLRDMSVGELTECSTGKHKYVFRYYDNYFNNPEKQEISLTLSKRQQEYRSATLFPFFVNLLSEGECRSNQAQLLGLDENDDFGILLATAQYDVSGAVTVKPL